MPTDLAQHIADIPVVDTHDHQCTEQQWLEEGPGDVLQDLFSHYPSSDLVSAGASQQAVDRLVDGTDPDVNGRWAAVAKAWEAMQFTGYGDAVRLHAKHVYDLDQITPEGAAACQDRLDALRKPGQRLALLRDVAKLDHVQTDNHCWCCAPDPTGPDFFLYDLSWVGFCGRSEVFDQVPQATGIEIGTLTQLRQAAEQLFEKLGPTTIAIKTQHAYNRTLAWSRRNDADAERALQAVLKDPNEWDTEAGLCLGDWGLARGIELATQCRLPIKIHTGYHAGVGRMPIHWTRPGNLCPLLKEYPDARFVLMHCGYPYGQELIALAKHYPNVWADMCWAWSIDPQSGMDFVRRFLHAAPINKLFAFGGDTHYPTGTYAYSLQMRKWLTKALAAEVADGELGESQATEVATKVLRDNQLACFDLDGTQEAIRRTS